MGEIGKSIASVQLTSKLMCYLKEAVEKDEKFSLRSEIYDYLNLKLGSPVPFSIIKHVFLLLRKHGEDIYLHEMLHGSNLVLPEVKLSPRNPELKLRIEKLKAAAQENEYRRMTSNVSAKQEFHFRDDVKSLNRQLVTVFNFLVTVAGAFAFGYKAAELSIGKKMFPVQVISGLLLATVVFFADLYFLVKYSFR